MNSVINPNDYYLLIVEDNASEREPLARILRDAGYRVSTADSGDKALSYLDESVDCVLTDLQMGDVSGMDLLQHWKGHSPSTLFLMITGNGSTQMAVEAIKAGAYHYMVKPIDINALVIMLKNMIRHREATRKLTILQDRLDENFKTTNIIGHTPQMERIFELIRRSAQAFSTVLILGESGTGKELVAEAIHQNSPRRNGPFIAVNCAAIPHGLVESELFGHEKGAFTGAAERRMGLFEAARGGTLFIDEIGDFDINLQVKLLRVIENRTVTPVGSNKEIKVDTRILAATSRNIQEMIAKGTFRSDLYYRLNIITVELPPLRERLDDIPLLVKRFVERVNKQNGTHITAISPEAIDALQQYHWPGNVRELLNVVERMLVLCNHDEIGLEDLPSFVRSTGKEYVPLHKAPSMLAPHERDTSSNTHTGTGVRPLTAGIWQGDSSQSASSNPGITSQDQFLEKFFSNITLDELESVAIGFTLRRFHNNRTLTAQALGISTRTLQRKLGPRRSAGEMRDDPLDSATLSRPEDIAIFSSNEPDIVNRNSNHPLAGAIG